MNDQIIDEMAFIGHVQWLGGRRLEIISQSSPDTLKEALIQFQEEAAIEIVELIKAHEIELYYLDDDGLTILEHGLNQRLPPRLIQLLLPHRIHLEEWLVNAFETYMETDDPSATEYTQLADALERAENYLDEDDHRRFEMIISQMKATGHAATLDNATPMISATPKRKML